MVNVSNFKEFVEKINRDINEKYNNFSVQLYNARKERRNNKSGKKKQQLFSLEVSNLGKNFDFNYGGQKEVQYHIHKDDYIYYGLGFYFASNIRDDDNKYVNPLPFVKPFIDTLFINEVQVYIEKLIEKGYSPFIHNQISSIDDFKEPEFGKYYLFGKSIQINNDEISDEDYENMLNDFATDLFELYKKIFDERNKSMENKDIQIDNENDLLNKCEELLESNYNLILTGAPGTGKTYLAKQIAAKMIFGEDKNLKDLNDDEKAKFEYQYKFVQFHPSYDYTDFVEGIRPVTKNDDTYGFKRKDGTFKEFCKRAAIFDKLQDFCEYLVNETENGKTVSLKNVQGSEEKVAPIKTVVYDRENAEVRIIVDTPNEKNNGISSTSLYLFVKWYMLYINVFLKLNIEEQSMTTFDNILGITYGNSHSYIYGFIQLFHEKLNTKIISSEKDYHTPFVFVIDEINRGDINKILGELFYAIDLGYRGEKGKVETQYQNLVESGDVFENGFYIPENVYIIGTMNDIDRSVESMDFAIRRRFAWQEVKPEDTADEILKDVKINNAASVLNDFNKMIADKDALGEMYQIGASYFLKLNNYINDDKVNDQESIKNAYQKLWDNHLKGLIHEYVRGKKSGEEIFDKIKNKYFDLTGINCKENNEDTAE